MASPVAVRIDATQNTPTGYIVPSGVKVFKDCLRGPDAATAFLDWRKQRFTKNLYLALQDMIIHQPREAQHDSLLVQHGITLGLTLAAQLVTDPSVLWPDVFGPGMTVKESDPTVLPEEFSTSVDDALDNE